MSTTIGYEYAPGSFDLIVVEIFGEGGIIDVTMFVEEFTMTETLMEPCIRGSMTIIDGLNIPSNLPITEGDVVHVIYRYNHLDKVMAEVDPYEIETTMEIVKISPQRKIKQDVQAYTLHLVSNTWSENLYERVSKTFIQKYYHEMVKWVYDNHLCKGGLKGFLDTKPLELEATDLLWDVIVPGWKPYQFIHWAAGRSFHGPACDYCFWEDVDQFHFRSVDSLKARGPVETYYVQIQNLPPQADTSKGLVNEELKKAYFHIEDYEFKEHMDVSLGAAAGMIGNHMITHDIYRKKVQDFYPDGPWAPNYYPGDVFDYISDFEKTNHCEKNDPLVRPQTNEHMAFDKGNARVTVFPLHKLQWDDMENWFPELWLRQRKSQMHALRYLRMDVNAIGNFKRRVGEVIEVKFPSPEWKPKGGSSSTQDPKPDHRLQGNWLIVSLRRIFQKSKYHLKMELIKDDYYEFAPDPIWKPVPFAVHNDKD